MTKTTALTVSDIEAGYNRDEWAGFGYLNGRRNAGDDDSKAKADALLLQYANAAEWDSERLFDFLNSKEGRWFADVTFGSFNQHRMAAIMRDTDNVIGGYLTRIGREMSEA